MWLLMLVIIIMSYLGFLISILKFILLGIPFGSAVSEPSAAEVCLLFPIQRQNTAASVLAKGSVTAHSVAYMLFHGSGVAQDGCCYHLNTKCHNISFYPSYLFVDSSLKV